MSNDNFFNSKNFKIASKMMLQNSEKNVPITIFTTFFLTFTTTDGDISLMKHTQNRTTDYS